LPNIPKIIEKWNKSFKIKRLFYFKKPWIICIFIFLITSVPIFTFFIPTPAGAVWYSGSRSTGLGATDEKVTCSFAYEDTIYAGDEKGSIYIVSWSTAVKFAEIVKEEVKDIIFEDDIIYAVNKKLWRVDPASGFSVEIITNSCSFLSFIKKDDVFYLSDDYGYLWEFNQGTGAKERIGRAGLGITDIVYYDDAIFAVSKDKCLYRFYKSGAVWNKEKIYNTGTKLYSIIKSNFSGEDRLYIGGEDSRLWEIYYKNGWKIFPIDYTLGKINGIISADVRGNEALYVYTDDGSWFEFSNSTSGYKKENIWKFSNAVNSAIFCWDVLNSFLDNKFFKFLSYLAVPPAGEGFKHQPSGELSIANSTTSYRNPLFPKKDEEIIFYFTDLDKAQDLSPQLYWKAESSSTWQTKMFSYVETGADYSVYGSSLTLNLSTGTVIEYFISSKAESKDVYISRPYEHNLSNNSNYCFGSSSSSASSNPFTFILAGTGNCFHSPYEEVPSLFSSMRIPLYLQKGGNVKFFVGNLSYYNTEYGIENYGDMTGGKIHYKENGIWKEKGLSWFKDINWYETAEFKLEEHMYTIKYWTVDITPDTEILYYFSVTYDDHNTTYVCGDDNISHTSGSETAAKALPFTLSFSTASFNINLSSIPELPLNLKIYEAGSYRMAYESEISSFARVSLPAGNYDLIINGGDYETIYDNITFPSSPEIYTPVLSKTPHSFTLSGNCEADFSANEKIAADSQSDSKWGITNEIYDLWTTYDSENIYIGLKGILGGNSIVLYLDCGDYLGSIKDASGLPWSQARNHKFPDGFRPDFQFTFWDFAEGSFYRITSSTTLDDVTSQVSQAVKGGGSGETGSIEIKIPFSVIYDGITGSGIPGGAEIKLLVAVTGGDGTSAKDAVPDQSSSFGGTFDEFTFDKYFVIPLDSDGGGVPDTGRYISDIAYSTAGVLSSQQAASSLSLRYTNFNAAEYFYQERDMPLSIYSVDADSAVLKWKNSAASVYSAAYPVLSASTFTFTVSAEYVLGGIDYYFVLYSGTVTQNTDVYSISVDPDITLTPGSKTYSTGDSQIVFKTPLGESVRLLFLDPESLITDNIVPSNSEMISTAGIRLPLELYEITGSIPPAAVTLCYFNEIDEINYAAYFYDGTNWVYKPASLDTAGNKITFNLNQQGKIGIFRITSSALPSGKNISSISKPVFNPGMGEKIEFNFIQNPSSINIEIFDMNGRKIKQLSGESGWDGRDRNNNVVPTGAYLYHLKTDTDDFWGMLGIWK